MELRRDIVYIYARFFNQYTLLCFGYRSVCTASKMFDLLAFPLYHTYWPFQLLYATLIELSPRSEPYPSTSFIPCSITVVEGQLTIESVTNHVRGTSNTLTSRSSTRHENRTESNTCYYVSEYIHIPSHRSGGIAHKSP